MFVICETSEGNMQEKELPIFFRYKSYPSKIVVLQSVLSFHGNNNTT